MIITDNGTIIRMHVSDISKIGRNTQGVRVMRLKDGEVATVAVAPREEDGPEIVEDEENTDVNLTQNQSLEEEITENE